jgi:hypothetical protein
MAEEGVEVNPAYARRCFICIENVRGLHHQMKCVGTTSAETAQIKERGITITFARLNGYVISVPPSHAACKLTTSAPQCSNHVWELLRSRIPVPAKSAHLSIIVIKLMVIIPRLSRARESVQTE